MCRFIESVKLQDGVFFRLEAHQQRIEKAFSLFYPEMKSFSLKAALYAQEFPVNGTFKCRIGYDTKVCFIEIESYKRRVVNSLKLVETVLETTVYKPSDRSGLLQAFELRSDCDDVLLVRSGLLTDTSYANVAVFDGENWWTPRVPLLYGVNRAGLLAEGRIKEKDIKVDDLTVYSHICLFNAMIEFGELVLPVSAIHS